MKRFIRNVTFWVAESCWNLVFAISGRLLQPGYTPWTPAGKGRVLVIAPHPDDETLGCGGAIALHLRAGDEVRVLVVTDGGSSRAGNLRRAEMARLRAREAEGALAELAPFGGEEGNTLSLTQLRLPEGLWHRGDLISRLVPLLEELRPEIIYTPSCIDFHPEHVRVASEVAKALERTPSLSCAVRIYEVQVPLTPGLTNCVADITAVQARKRAALAEYKTQLASMVWWERKSRYLGRLYGTGGHLEAFYELSPIQFCLLEGACGRYTRSAPARFRGLRPRPFTDGFAWLVGLRLRVRLEKSVHKRLDKYRNLP